MAKKWREETPRKTTRCETCGLTRMCAQVNVRYLGTASRFGAPQWMCAECRKDKRGEWRYVVISTRIYGGPT